MRAESTTFHPLLKADELKSCGDKFLGAFLITDNNRDLCRAIEAYKEAISYLSEDEPNLGEFLNGDAQQHAVQLTRDSHTRLPSWLNALAASLRTRFERTGDLHDASEAIRHLQHAIHLTSDRRPELDTDSLPLQALLNNLGLTFWHRFKRTRDMRDISNAIQHQRHAVQLMPDGHSRLPLLLDRVATSLSGRFEYTGDIPDISEAIRHRERAVQLTPAWHKSLPSYLNNLGFAFSARFNRTEDLQDISDAIRHQQQSVQLTPPGDADLMPLLSNLGNSLSARFKHTGDMQDITNAIRHQQQAVQISDGHVGLPQFLNNLGSSFLDRFEHTGDIKDISEAIRYQQRAVQLALDGHHANLPGFSNNLGRSFWNRFEKGGGDMHDISEAIRYQQHAVQLTPDEHADMPCRLNNLGVSFCCRFKHSEDMDDISEAIRHLQRAIHLTSDGRAGLQRHHGNLGTSFWCRFERSGDVHDISEAIRHLERAVQLTPDEHPNMPGCLFNLGSSFLSRFERTRDMHHISDAIGHLQHAIRLTPDGHANLPVWRNYLGISFWNRFNSTGTQEDLRSALSNYRLCATSFSGSLSFRLSAAQRWATLSQLSCSSPSDLLDAHSCIIRLLSLISGLENTVQRRHENLIDTSQLPLAAAAAALSLDHPDKALEWLVEGRCIVWNQIDQLRAPTAKLQSYDPALAEQFSFLSRELENAGLRPDSRGKLMEFSMKDKISLEDEARMHNQCANDWERLLGLIRNIPQFEDYLQPKKCANIMSGLPEEGPIVIVNVHPDRCDALVLMAGAVKPLHIPLPDFSFDEAERLASGMRSYLLSFGFRSRLGIPIDSYDSGIVNDFPTVLKALWFDVVSPILDALAISIPNSSGKLPRIWWCPTGPLASLPIHAAGIYEQGKGIPGQCLSEFAVSSYIPSPGLNETFNPAKNCGAPAELLMVSQPDTPGKAQIRFARDEVERVKRQLGVLSIASLTLDGENATVNHVLKSMEKFPCIHLACHASQHEETPLKSAIHLHDGPLALSVIMKKNLHNADFAFLSACQTSMGDKSISEEVVHLASGMLAAGYRSVVGTMWSVFDMHCPDLAEFFYKRMLEDETDEGMPRIDGRRAARALHEATKQLREKESDSPNSFFTWVPYIHIGI